MTNSELAQELRRRNDCCMLVWGMIKQEDSNCSLLENNVFISGPAYCVVAMIEDLKSTLQRGPKQ